MDDWNEDTIPHKIIVVDTLLIPVYHIKSKKKKGRDWKHILGVIWLCFCLLFLATVFALIVWYSIVFVNWSGN